MRKIVALIAALLLCSPAWAMRTPMFGGLTTTLSTSATRYLGFSSNPVATNDTTVRTLAPMAGKIENLKVYISAAPDNGAGTQSYTFTFQKNGADATPTLACTISESSQTCSATGIISLAAGDSFSIKAVPSGTPTAAFARFSTVFNSGTGGGAILYTSNNGTFPATSGSSAVGIIGGLGWGQSGQTCIMPTSGTISSLYVYTPTAPGAGASGKQFVFTFQKNSVDTAVTCTLFETATTCNDTTHSFSFVAGDHLKLVATATNTPSAGAPVFAAVMTPTIDGESIYSGQYGGGAISASVDNFQSIQGYWGGYSTTDFVSSIYIPIDGIVAKKLRAYSDQSPGASPKAITNDLRRNTTANSADTITTGITCTRSGASGQTSCNDSTNSYTLSAGDWIFIRWHPVSTPTVGTANAASIVLYIDPNNKIYGSTTYA